MADGKTSSAVSSDKSVATKATYLKDYRAPDFLIDSTQLDFDLGRNISRVSSVLSVRKNPVSDSADASLVLNGEDLNLISIDIDGRSLADTDYCLDGSTLQLSNLPDAFELCIVTQIDPAKNLKLEGLYLSDGMYCTQCEAEGFRRITYYLDRPDVMSVFTTKITADASRYPVLLSNGNEVGRGRLTDGRHWVEWHDPFKKPAYLFALVAGDLELVEDSFTTQSGRKVALRIYVEEKDVDKCGHAIQSLQAAMTWDEKVYGREYDLDLYMIVAVDFFNMGAMENKGLNIFNTSCVLAHPSTQSDIAFQRVEGVVAHEYFHNWSGNRVTCRDWFQLSLKEGFTVFRDACFSADMNSATVKRIEDVSLLRSAQFAEDSGPMSHPIRPESYIEISNFYTLTIYEKGAEVIRMMHQLLGAETFRLGSDLYFDRHDGQAVTCEDFVCAMEDASGIDLTQFRLWYAKSGTPNLEVADSWDKSNGIYTLTINQSCRSMPGSGESEPFFIPLRVALLSDQGLEHFSIVGLVGSRDKNKETNKEMSTEAVLELCERNQTWQFSGLKSKPVPSLLRGFSAPVKLNFDYSLTDLLLLLREDTDGFARWDASQRYAMKLIEGHVSGRQLIDSSAGKAAISELGMVLEQLLQSGFDNGVWNHDYDAALIAEILRLPGYSYVIEQFDPVDITALHAAIELLSQAVAKQLKDVLLATYQRLQKQLSALGAYRPQAEDIALRSLKNICLSYLMRVADSQVATLAYQQFTDANNMTDQSAALSALVNCQSSVAELMAMKSLNAFYQQWSHESLVVNQWLTIQACSEKSGALSRVKELMNSEAYDNTNPNKVRALIGGYCARNLSQFHSNDGSGYELLADEVIRLNPLNPQLASRLLAPLTQWRRFVVPQKTLMQNALLKISHSENLSADVYEVVLKSLNT